jgi:hypothetical protein
MYWGGVRPVSDFVRFPSGWNFGREKLMRENSGMTLSWSGGRGRRCTKFVWKCVSEHSDRWPGRKE